MASPTKIGINLGKLDKLRKGLATDMYARVGILGAAKDSRTDGDGLTNSELGIMQMFGTAHIPPRDFLDMPIRTKKKELVKVLTTKTVKDMVAKGNLEGVFKIIGIKGEEIVQQGFETGGFGRWAPLAPETIEAKGSSKILINTAQLRRSITSDVQKD